MKMRKKTDGGYDIPEEDLWEMEQEEAREMPEGVETQTGICRFCGQSGVVHPLTEWSQTAVDEAVTSQCQCREAKEYAKGKNRVQKARIRIDELFGTKDAVHSIMYCAVDSIEAGEIKGIIIDLGQGIKARISKTTKESIKVERSEIRKKVYEE